MFSSFYSSISLLSSLLVLSLLPWFIRFKNVSGLFIIAWLFTVNFLYGLNAATFTGDALLRAPVYCDILTKLLMGMQMVVPTAMLCYTFSIHDWMVRPKERNLDEKYFEYRSCLHAALCLLTPLIYMALHIAAQDHRFDLVEDVGCIPSSSSTAVSWVLIWEIPMAPFCVLSIYGFFAFKYAWVHHRKYYAAYMTSWELVDSELLFTKAPFGIFRIVRLSVMIVAVMLWTLLTPYYAIAIFVHANVFVFFQKPDLSRVDVFSSLSAESLSVTTMRLFLWSGPLYSVLFFVASMDKDVLLSYPFLFKKYILRRPIGVHPDPSPGIDLSTLTPIPVRKRLHRRVIRKSRQYDPPLSFLDYDLPLPPRPDPGYRATAALPPVPASVPVLVKEPHRPEAVHIKDGVRGGQRSRAPRKGTRAFEEAMRQHVEACIDFPMHTIPESPPLNSSEVPSVGGGYDSREMRSRDTIDNMV